MATRIPALPMTGTELKIALDGLRSDPVLSYPSLEAMIADGDLSPGDQCLTPRGRFGIEGPAGPAANGRTVLELAGIAGRAVLGVSEPLENPAELLADTRPAAYFVTGDQIRTRDGFSYRVLDAAAPNAHLATAGGLKLMVEPMPGQMGFAAAAFGVDDTGTDSAVAEANAIALQAAIDAAHATGFGQVFLGRSTYITSLALHPGVVLVGGAHTADIADYSAFGGSFAATGSYLIQKAGTNAPAIHHDYADHDGDGLLDGSLDKARALGLRRVTITAEVPESWSETTHPVGLRLRNCAFVVCEQVFVQNFRRNIDLQDCYDSTFVDLRSGPCERGLRIGNRGDVDNSNNLKFLHARIESWTRCGIEILSGGNGGFQNNKIDFISLKNEGHPGVAADCGLRIDGNVEVRFLGGYTSIIRNSAPPASFRLVDVTTEAAEVVNLQFLNFGLDTNGYEGTIDSLVSVAPGARAIQALDLDCALSVSAGTTFGRGLIALAPGNYKGVGVKVRSLFNPDGHPVFWGLANLPTGQSRISLPDQSLSRALTVRSDSDPVSFYLARASTGSTWEFRVKGDGSLGVFLNNAEVATYLVNGNLALGQQSLAVATAVGLRTQGAAPATIGGGMTLAVANGTTWDPAAQGAGPYLAVWTGSVWKAVAYT
ncbi:hypothetical protein [Histidinibacterium lentulum]|uniref:Uncharacterized protein n=1 Tax=Histidinibacterium lentulum TaxID=2480588 RepID=A0A3N2QSR2_9RHOB|nr:hypothetical protein [Histidinibacterium lentulum]ROT98045.1 hypothetical protein EAT49_17390 [Histidinibacterium lentulum]